MGRANRAAAAPRSQRADHGNDGRARRAAHAVRLVCRLPAFHATTTVIAERSLERGSAAMPWQRPTSPRCPRARTALSSRARNCLALACLHVGSHTRPALMGLLTSRGLNRRSALASTSASLRAFDPCERFAQAERLGGIPMPATFKLFQLLLENRRVHRDRATLGSLILSCLHLTPSTTGSNVSRVRPLLERARDRRRAARATDRCAFL